MKTIKVAKNKYAMVDDEDYDWLAPLTGWHLNKNNYAALSKYVKGTSKMHKGKQVGAKHRTILMSRLVMFAKTGQEVDHIDGNPLNNQKSNLRICTSRQNKGNQRPRRQNQFKGVNQQKRSYAYICGKMIGGFDDPHTAALAYDFWATEVFGEFAYTNFPVVSSFTR